MAVAKKITNDTMVQCKNGTHGPLIYDSSRNTVSVEWGEFGEVQDLEYGELLIMRGTQPRFFRDNWILIDDADVLRKLGVELYYKNSLTSENFVEVFKWEPDKIRAEVPKMSDGMKDSIRIRAKELLKDEKLDSRSIIKAFNEVFDCDLEEELMLEKKPEKTRKTVETVTIK